MKISRFLVVAVLCTGCVSHHPAKAPAPIIPPTKLAPGATTITKVAPLDNSAQELKALRAVTGQVTPKATVPTVPTKITPEAPDVVPTDEAPPSPPVVHNSTPVHDAVNTVKTVKSHKLIACNLIVVFVGGALWITSLWAPLWLPYFKKFLAFVKTKNVVKNLDTLATEAKTKMEVDFKDVQKKL
jgi:hypothetical protein